MTFPASTVNSVMTGNERLCKYCGDPFTPRNDQQEFCVGKNCRQKWHRERRGELNGRVHGIYQRPSGGWSIVLHFDDLPPNLKRGHRVTNVETVNND